MLVFNLRELDAGARSVDGWLAPDDPVWAEGDPRPAAPVHVTGRLSRAGAGRYYWSGQLDGVAITACRRCLTATQVEVAEPVNAVFAEPGDEVAEDPDAFLLPPRAGTIDLRPAVREYWLLGVPEFALCQEGCRGLCPSCGANLNASPCGCPPDSDRRPGVPRVHRATTE